MHEIQVIGAAKQKEPQEQLNRAAERAWTSAEQLLKGAPCSNNPNRLERFLCRVLQTPPGRPPEATGGRVVSGPPRLLGVSDIVLVITTGVLLGPECGWPGFRCFRQVPCGNGVHAHLR